MPQLLTLQDQLVNLETRLLDKEKENVDLIAAKRKAEQQTIEQTQLYKSIFNSTFDAVLILNKESEIVEVNDVACEIFQKPSGSFIGRELKKFLLSYDPRVMDFTRLKIEGSLYFQAEGALPEDRVINLECRARLFNITDIPHVMLMLRDISEQIRTENALKKSKKFSEIIAETSPVVLWLTNEAGELNYINSLWLEWTGSGFEKNKGFGWFQFIYEPDRKSFVEKFRHAFENQIKLDSDFRIINKQGVQIWANIKAEPYFGIENFFSGFAGSMMDITSRKEAEQALHHQHKLTTTLTDNATLALFLMNKEGECTYMNPTGGIMTGFSLTEIKNKSLFHCFKPEGNANLEFKTFLNGKDKLQGEANFHNKAGKPYPVFFTSTPILENDEVTQVILEVRDTSEEKHIQRELRGKDQRAKEQLEILVKERTMELEKINYELLQFTSIVSHDLKEPVRKISIFSNLLKGKLLEVLNEKDEKYLNNIIKSSSRMIELINDLLTFSRLSQTDQLFLKTDLNEILASVVQDFELAIEEKIAKISIGEMPVVEGVAFQLGQVFQNLISNSLKFNDPKRPLEIVISCSKIDNEFFRISYSDNGIGFNHKFNNKVFEVFQRLHPKDIYEGTGIGLSIVKKIISLHNGTITASGIEGEGARFDMVLPYTQKNQSISDVRKIPV